MNILLSTGVSAHFNREDKKGKFKSWGGVCVAAYYFMRIIKAYPEHTFYYIGSNDIDTLTNKPANLINIDKDIKVLIKKYVKEGRSKYDAAVDYIKENNLHFDKAFLFYTYNLSLVEYDKGYLCSKGTPRHLLESEKNLAYTWYPIKYFNIPYYVIEDDCRQAHNLPADMPRPIAILGQMNLTDKSKMYIDIENRDIVETPIIYTELPQLYFGTYNNIPDWRNKKRNNEFVLALNGNPQRLKYLQKWVFPYRPNQIIYGTWDANKAIRNAVDKSGMNDNFVLKGIREMENEMFDTKYTLVVPLANSCPEFTTLKVWIMAYYGIIPFWCKNEYDSTNILKMFPDYIKVETPDEMWKKIDELNNNEELYFSILNQIYEAFDKRMFNESDEYTRIVFDKFLK